MIHVFYSKYGLTRNMSLQTDGQKSGYEKILKTEMFQNMFSDYFFFLKTASWHNVIFFLHHKKYVTKYIHI